MLQPLDSKYRFWRWRIFIVSWLAYAGFYFCRKNFGIAMPLLTKEMGYTKDDFAIILFMYSLFYAMGQFYNGFFSDKFGPRLVVGIGMALSILANIFMGFSTALLVFGILICVNGMGQSTGWPGTVKNMAPWFRRQERGIVLSWWATCYVVGGIAATAFATFVVTHPLLFRPSDIKDPAGLVVQLRQHEDNLSQYLYNRLSPEIQKALADYRKGNPVPQSLRQALGDELNTIVQGPFFYSEELFNHIHLTEGTTKKISKFSRTTSGQIQNKPTGKELARFNKTLLLEAYPHELRTGWRRSFWAPSFILFGIMLCYIGLTRNKPSDVGLPSITQDEETGPNDKAGQTPTRKQDASAEGEEMSSREILSRVIRNPIVWLISVMYFFTKMGRYAILFWLPMYMVEHLGYNLAEAGYTSILYEAVGFLGVVAAGYVSDKLFQSRRMPVGALGMWGLAIVCFFHPRLAAWGHLGNAIGISLIGFFTYGPDSLMSGAAAIDAGSPRASGFAAGMVNGVGSLGQMLSGFVVAYIAKQLGWDSLFYFFVIISLLGGCLLALKWNWVPEAHRIADAAEKASAEAASRELKNTDNNNNHASE